MMFPEGNSKGMYLSTKIGSKHTIRIDEIKKIEDSPKFDLKYKDGSTAGYHYELITTEGIITVNTWALIEAINKSEASVGDTITIEHTGMGQYKITKQ